MANAEFTGPIDCYASLTRRLNSICALPVAEHIKASLCDPRPGVEVRIPSTVYCEDCALIFPESINPTTAVAVRCIEFVLYAVVFVVRDGSTIRFGELLCSGEMPELARVADQVGRRFL